MENNLNEQIKLILAKLDNKDFGIYFFVADSKGNPTAAIANIYEHVKMLNELGYKAYILHEKNDYTGVNSWLGSEYASLPHVSIEAQNLNIGAQDFILIPEVFSNVMDQTKKFPCKRIVFSQAHDYIFEMLGFGMSWANYGISDVITTSEKQANYIKSLFPSVSTSVVPVSIPDYFKPCEKPVKPIISVVARNQKDILKVIKAFYLQYPMYKWITFRELKGMAKIDFATALADSMLLVWIDDEAGFGTAPLEAIQCDVPVIGKIPQLVPEWMEESTTEDGLTNLKYNGIWCNNLIEMPNLIAQFVKVHLEDSVPQHILDGMVASKGQYTSEKQKQAIEKVYGEMVTKRKAEIINLNEKGE